MTRATAVAGFCFALGISLLTTEAATGQERVRGISPLEIHGTVKSIDVAGGKITIATGSTRQAPGVETTYSLAKEVEFAIGSPGSALGRGTGMLFKEGKLADLSAGTSVILTLAADKETVESILAEEPTVHGKLKSVDKANHTITVTTPAKGRQQAAQEITYTVAGDADIISDDGRGTRVSLKEAKLPDLVEGSLVALRLSLDGKHVHGIVAEGPTLKGKVKDADTAKKTLTLVVASSRGDNIGEAITFQVPEEAVILLDDGRGRRLSVKRAKLADIPSGASALVRLTPDQQFATSIRAHGPTLSGLLRAVDASKGVITIAIPRGRGEEPEEKSLTLAKDARINIDGVPSTIGDLKVADGGPYVQLGLSLDQRMVQSVVTQRGRGR